MDIFTSERRGADCHPSIWCRWVTLALSLLCTCFTSCVSHLVPPAPSTLSSCWPLSTIFLLSASHWFFVFLLFCFYCFVLNRWWWPIPEPAILISLLCWFQAHNLNLMLSVSDLSVWHCDVISPASPLHTRYHTHAVILLHLPSSYLLAFCILQR